MELNRVFDHAAECERRAALRQNILQYGRLLRWSTRTSIAFVERATRRPWKRRTSDQLAAVISDLHAIHQGLARSRPPIPVVDQSETGADHLDHGQFNDNRS
jgi:hypothetical protein